MSSHGEIQHNAGGDAALSTALSSRDALRWRAQTFLANRDAIIITDLDGCILDWNPAAERIYGYTRDEALGQLTDFIHLPEDGSALRRAMLDGMRQTGSWSGEVPFVRKDGTRGICETTVSALVDDAGRIVAAFGVNHDITERKRLEAERAQALADEREARAQAEAARDAAEAATARLRTVLEVLPAGVSIADAQGHIQVLNPAFYAAWGKSAPLSGAIEEYGEWKGWWTRTGERVKAEEWAMARTLLTGEVVRNEEIDIEAFDGVRRTILNDAAPIRDKATGEITGGVVALLDVTEQRRIEREAAEHARELEAMFDAITDGILIANRDGSIRRCNRAYRELLGYDPYAAGGAAVADEPRDLLYPRDGAGHPLLADEWPLTRILAGETITSEQARDIGMRTPDGREIAVSSTGAPLRDREGKITGAVLVVRDVTERRRLERALAERAHEAEAERIRWQAAMDGTPEWVCTCDAEQRLTYVNPAYERILGQRVDLTTPPEGWATEYGLFLPDSATPFPAEQLPLPRALREGRPVMVSRCSIVRLLAKSGWRSGTRLPCARQKARSWGPSLLGTISPSSAHYSARSWSIPRSWRRSSRRCQMPWCSSTLMGCRCS